MHNIVYITDNNYVLPTKTSINSIVQNVKDTELCVNVIAVDVSERNQNELKNLSSKNVTVKILEFGNEFVDLGLDHLYVSKAALFKFQLPVIFKDLERILYVDGDMILNSAFLEIFDFDISEKYAAVVADMLAMKFEGWHEKIGHERYFNSGMMYLNLSKLRADMISDKLIEYKKNDKEGHFMDQNALNAVIGSNIMYVSPKFNMMASCNSKTIKQIYGKVCSEKDIADFYNISEVELKDALENPAILHVTSESKVWKNIHSARIDSWIPFVTTDDTLKVAKNWCASISSDLSNQITEQGSTLQNQFSVHEQRLSQQEARITDHDRQIADLRGQLDLTRSQLDATRSQLQAAQERLESTYNLLVNTRHRTLYGALAWLWHKVFKRR